MGEGEDLKGAVLTGQPETQRRIAVARSEFLESGRPRTLDVSHLIAASWERSLSAGVDATRLHADYHDDLDESSRLFRCAAPVLRQLSEETTGLPLSIALTDSNARILSRVDTDPTIGRLLDEVQMSEGFQYSEGAVGTNGIGTVLESGQSVLVVGSEHFHEDLSPFACAGAPIRNPFSGRIEGVLDLTCVTERSTPLMHTLARSVAQGIEKNLFIDRSHHQQDLFDLFHRVDARTHNAVIAMGGGVVMGNAHAQRLFTHAEQLTIHAHGQYLVNRTGQLKDEIELCSGKVVRIRGTRVAAGDETRGVVLEVTVVSEGPAPSPQRTNSDHDQADPRKGDGNFSAPLKLLPSQASTSDYPSPLWKRAADEVAKALNHRRALLVVGTAGVGKFSLVDETYHRLNPGCTSLAIDATDLTYGSPGEVEEAVRGAGTSTLCIFRNIDKLSPAGVQRLRPLLQDLTSGEGTTRVAATVSGDDLDSDLPFRDLLRYFDEAVTVPALQYRPDDLPLLITRVLANIGNGGRSTMSPAALHVLSRYTWPRNLRELEEVLLSTLSKRPVGEVQPDDLPGHCHQSSARRLTVIEVHERDAIVQALRDAGGNRVQAAAALGIARSSLYRKIKSYGITT